VENGYWSIAESIAILTWKKTIAISIVILFPPSIAIAIAIFLVSSLLLTTLHTAQAYPLFAFWSVAFQ